MSGMLLKFSSGIMESEVLTLLNNIKVDGTPVGTLADANVYMMIIGGVFVMVIGVLGLCGAWNNIKECLWAVSTYSNKTRFLITSTLNFEKWIIETMKRIIAFQN